jgi:hypothetical protein
MNFLSEKKYGVPSHNFVKKNVLCEKGDEITRFDGSDIFYAAFIVYDIVIPYGAENKLFYLFIYL